MKQDLSRRPAMPALPALVAAAGERAGGRSGSSQRNPARLRSRCSTRRVPVRCPRDCGCRLSLRPRQHGEEARFAPTLRWREMDSNHRYPAKFFWPPVDPAQIHLSQYNRLPRDRDRWFESISLQRGVWCEPDFRAGSDRTSRAEQIAPTPVANSEPRTERGIGRASGLFRRRVSFSGENIWLTRNKLTSWHCASS